MSLVPCFDRDREPLVTVGYGAGHWDSPDRIEINVTRCLTAEALGRGSGALYTQCGVTHDFLGICVVVSLFQNFQISTTQGIIVRNQDYVVNDLLL